MGHLLSSLSFLLILIATNYATELTGLDYWNSVLPKTPMPNAITELLDLGNPNHRKHPHFAYAGLGKPTVSCLKYEYGCGPPPSEDQLHSDRNLPMFFLEKDLNPGKTMNLHFTRTMSTASNFIPRSEADKLPFSSSKFSEILNNFKVAKDSPQADVIKQTLQDCEEPAIRGEKQYCATSLESMVDFAVSSLKTYNVRALSTNLNSRNAPKQDYMIIKSKLAAQNELVACHVEAYAYAVFYCHLATSSKAYKVSLVGKDGGRVDTIAVCHMDTSSWNPKHLAFQMLKVQPGAVPICHFIPQGHVAWTRSM